MRHAAAVLVLRQNRALGFLQYAREGVSIPCGWVEEGETAAQAAIRECLEETGYQVEVTEHPPYRGFDPVGGVFVTTFMAEIVGEGEPTTPHEGKSSWVSIRTLTEGPFGHYNERMLNHFSVNPWPLVGKFHSHLTLKGGEEEVKRASKLTGGKVTYINLSRGDTDRRQTDAMVTHHYLTGAHGLEDEHDVLALLKAKARQLMASGIQVERVKLEYEAFGKKSPRGDVDRALQRIPYTEIHVKTLIPHKWPEETEDGVDSLLDSLLDDDGPQVNEELRQEARDAAAQLGWHPSSNPFAHKAEGVVQFMNRRYYVETGDPMSWEDINEDIDYLVMNLVEMGLDIMEIKYETAIYDSNDEVDRWWME